MHIRSAQHARTDEQRPVDDTEHQPVHHAVRLGDWLFRPSQFQIDFRLPPHGHFNDVRQIQRDIAYLFGTSGKFAQKVPQLLFSAVHGQHAR